MSFVLVHGDWNQQVTLVHSFWALSDCNGMVVPVLAVTAVVVALSSVICFVSFSHFLLVLGVGVKLRVFVGEYSDSCMIFCLLLSGVVCSSSVSDDCC